MRHNLFQNEQEYRKWASKVEVETDGLARGGGRDRELSDQLLKNKPLRYPCITVSTFYSAFDRFGDNHMRIYEHVYLDEFTNGFNPYQAEDDYELEEKRKRPYWIALERFRDLLDANAPEEALNKQRQRIDAIEKRLTKKGVKFSNA